MLFQLLFRKITNFHQFNKLHKLIDNDNVIVNGLSRILLLHFFLVSYHVFFCNFFIFDKINELCKNQLILVVCRFRFFVHDFFIDELFQITVHHRFCYLDVNPFEFLRHISQIFLLSLSSLFLTLICT